jgi:hypothetical protein
VLVYALYAFLNKGIAYSYLVEILFVVGLVILLKDFKNLEIVWNRPVQILLGLIAICFLFIIRALGKYPFMEIIRDSFIINYALFVFILFMLRDEIAYVKERIFAVYKWYPIVACCSFLLFTYFPFFETFILFGKIPLLLYKFGDMGVQLLISSLLMLNGYVKMSKRWAILNTVLTIYLFLVIAAYSRSGALSYLVGMGLFFVFMKNKELKQTLIQYLKFAPLVGLIAISFYVGTKVQDNFQGRKVGLDQLKENALSIVGQNSDGTLSDNKAWRLLWWAKIIDYTFTSENFALGKGLGMSLAQEDEIDKPGEGDLRSPHNFHLNILARFGVPIFLIWCYWLFLHFKIFRDSELSSENLMYLSIFAAFIVNASFDVYLEGPMGAFPFWTFLGIFYISYFKTSPKQLGPI